MKAALADRKYFFLCRSDDGEAAAAVVDFLMQYFKGILTERTNGHEGYGRTDTPFFKESRLVATKKTERSMMRP